LARGCRALADVRDLIERHLPAEVREKPTWRHVASLLPKAAAGADMIDIGMALQMVLGLKEKAPAGAAPEPRFSPDHL
jgi:hypothetical protein